TRDGPAGAVPGHRGRRPRQRGGGGRGSRRAVGRRVADGSSGAVPRGREGHRDLQRHRGAAAQAARGDGPAGPRPRPGPADSARQPRRGGTAGPAAVPEQLGPLPLSAAATRARPAARAGAAARDRPGGAGADRDGGPADRRREAGRRARPPRPQGPRRPAGPRRTAPRAARRGAPAARSGRGTARLPQHRTAGRPRRAGADADGRAAGGVPGLRRSGPARTPTGAGERAVRYAVEQIGKPYEWGAEGPAAYDCSGLTSEAWAAAGTPVPRTSQEQWAELERVPLDRLRPGDLVVYFPEATH